MSSLPKPQNKSVCYRCRNTSQESNDLLKCFECPSFWHLECISLPLESEPTDEWICPRHQKTSKRASFSRKRISKIRAREEMIEEFEVAEQIIKYGGVTHKLSEGTLESDFLDYAQRYREVMHPQQDENDDSDIESQSDEDNDKPICFEYQDGIQLLLDAADIRCKENHS
ncbi:hypothetical protein EDC94DRAFT_700141 [Helicostylum pulchrum]|nr:hypothetical protein EDC94DRAFT_700141 [Helicostylum pulchrum]